MQDFFSAGVEYDCSTAATLEACEESVVFNGGSGVPDADLVLYVTVKEATMCAGGATAYAGHCLQDDLSLYGAMHRPLAAHVNFCPSRVAEIIQMSGEEDAGHTLWR